MRYPLLLAHAARPPERPLPPCKWILSLYVHSICLPYPLSLPQAVLRFLQGPEYRHPVMSFVDDNCLIFSDEEENKVNLQRRWNPSIPRMWFQTVGWLEEVLPANLASSPLPLLRVDICAAAAWQSAQLPR